MTSQPAMKFSVDTDRPDATTTIEDPFSREVWETTYKHHSDATIDDTFWRVAKYIASAEETEELRQIWARNFYEMLTDFHCTPGGRILANAGTDWAGTTMMNCFVSPRDKYDIDSIHAIVKDVENQAQTLKSEGGWGQNFSWLRPRGAFIHGIGVETPGSVKYMEIYDKVSDVITSGSGKKSTNTKAKAKIRKGAMMGTLDVWHPDIIEFITAKQQPGRLTKFNVSVNCTDEFMTKVAKATVLESRIEKMKKRIERTQNDKSPLEKELGALTEEFKETDRWSLRFPDTTFKHYREVWDGDIKEWEARGFPTIEYREVSVLWLWNLITESTYNRNEPGVLFLDRANHYDPLASYYHKIVATNPCGEQTLPPGGVCDLGSINLTQFVKKDRTGFDLEKLKKFTRFLVRFLDNVNTLSNAPLPEYIDSMRKKRRIGVGILGWGSSLFLLKVRFGSDESARLRDEVMGTIAREAYMASVDLAEEKGMFAYCDPKKHSETPFVKSLDLPQDYICKMRDVGIRNSSLLSVQPTGNTSCFANVVSGGLEPIFMPEYTRTVIIGTMPDEIAHACPKWFEGEWFETELFKFTKEGDEEILRGEFEGTVFKIDKNRGLTKEVPCADYAVRHLKETGEWDPEADWAVTTTGLSVKDHVSDMKGFSRWIDSAMSKTVNLPNKYPYEDFQNLYLDAYLSGTIRGITTYRDGTMTTVLSAKEEREGYDEEIIKEDVKLPDQMPGVTTTMRADGKKWWITTLMDEEGKRPVAFFVNTNHPEKDATTHDAVDKLMALAKSKKIPKKWRDEVEDKMRRDNNVQKLCRTAALNLRHGVLIKNVVGALESVEDVYVGSFLFQFRKHLSGFIKDGEKADNEKCVECGGDVVYSEGCKKCISCGNSKCG